MTFVFIGPRTRKYVKGYTFLLFTRNLFIIYSKKSLDAATKTGLDAAKTAPKNVVY